MKPIPAVHFHPQSPSAVSTCQFSRRGFLQQSVLLAGGCALCLKAGGVFAAGSQESSTTLVSPGCRRSKVRVAKLYLGQPKAHWPTPNMDIQAEMASYEADFGRMKKALADVDFTVNKLISKKEELAAVQPELANVDGILLIHLSMGISALLTEILAAKKPTALFAAPYSGHEWAHFGELRAKPEGENLECFLTSDRQQLAAAIRPFRAIHHLREAKVVNVSTRPLSEEWTKAVAQKFGTQFKLIDDKRVQAVYDSISTQAAEEETRRLIRKAKKVVEPSRQEIFNSCRLALAFEKILAEEDATAITADCYGSMYRKLPAFPCIGNVRLNDMGLAGICESDLTSAMTFLLLQGLSGKPGFISDPTVDESRRSIILAHCLGSTKMDGPDGPQAPYKLRTIMERQEGAVPQVFMRVGQKVTQAIFVGTDQLLYFTGDVIAAPDVESGCRTKIDVRVDGSIEKLWHNWSHGLHRVTCYGDLIPDLQRFCRYKKIELVNEA